MELAVNQLNRIMDLPLAREVKAGISIRLFRLSLKALALSFAVSPKMRREIMNPSTGFVFNARYQFSTRDGKVHAHVLFANGRARSGAGRIENPDVTIFYRDAPTLARLWSQGPEEALANLLTNDMSYTGNMAYLTKFSYMTTLLAPKKNSQAAPPPAAEPPDVDAGGKRKKHQYEALDRPTDNVRFLPDPYISRYSIADFPRLARLRNRRFAAKPAICIERARLVTEFHREHGFETDRDGSPFNPDLRQAMALSHVLRNKKPVILADRLLAGSTTSHEVGVPVYPELIGTVIWPELRTIGHRELNPNDLSPEDADVLNFEVFPFWMNRNIREYCRTQHGNPLSQQLEERFVLYFMMKNNAISHTIPDFQKVVAQGLSPSLEKARQKETRARLPEKRDFYRAVGITLEGVLAYAGNLAAEASRQAAALSPVRQDQAQRRAELLDMAAICEKVPAGPAKTVHEAVMAIWIVFVCLHQENANSALSIGRLDQILQPCFAHDFSAAKTGQEREAVIHRTLTLCASLFLQFNDHDPLVPDVGNRLFGGSSSDDTVTVGGVTPDGENAVCDMTFILLKAAEMLGFQDPNMNARFHPEKNSRAYLRRLCEVNVNMGASPIIHNDRAMIASLKNQGIAEKDARDWGATGCVEPTICGRHYGHTNCMLLNMVAPLEMALNNGTHPVMGEAIGPATGDVAADFPAFADFLAAYKAQLAFLADQSVQINNFLGEAHQYIHPTPLLSSLYEGPLDKGLDLIRGGARYNSSGAALVSITDVVDSLMVIKKLVYEKKEVGFPELMDALANDFAGERFAVLES
ncbi:MAG: pyruvate formate lyase family protein, partial [Pseudomonadota bacterium]